MAETFCGTGSSGSYPKPGDPSNDSSLSASPITGGILVEWTWPSANGHAVANVQLYRSTVPSIESMSLVAVVSGSSYIDRFSEEELVDYYYWIEIVSIQGTVGDLIGPASAMPRSTVRDTLELLTGEINASFLDISLREKIGEIDINREDMEWYVDDYRASDSDIASVFTGRINTLVAEVADNYSAIQQEASARVNEIEGMSQLLTTVQTQIGDDIASVQEDITTIIDTELGKLNAMWELKVDVNGLVGGIGIFNDGDIVDFAIRADRFSVAPPNRPQDAVVPFQVKGYKTYIREALIEQLTFDKLTDAGGTFIVQNGKLKAEYIETSSLSVTDGGVVTIKSPGGGQASLGSSGLTGAIKIRLPQGWTSTMMYFAVDVFNYGTGKSFTLQLGGYTYAGGGGKWHNLTVSLVGSAAADNGVRFGYDGSKCCIFIGERNSSWHYLSVVVRDFQGSRDGAHATNWDSGWQISLATSFPSQIDHHFPDALVDSKDTLNVAGESSTVVRDRAYNGNLAKSRVDGWSYPGTTEIHGAHIRTGTIKADKIQIGGSGGLGSLAGKNNVGYNEVTGTKPPTNADRTASNTAYDTARVNGTSSYEIEHRAMEGWEAKQSTKYWIKPGTTLIDGGKLYTHDAFIVNAMIKNAVVDTLEIKGEAVAITRFTNSGSTGDLVRGHKTGAVLYTWTNWATNNSLSISSGSSGGQTVVTADARGEAKRTNQSKSIAFQIRVVVAETGQELGRAHMIMHGIEKTPFGVINATTNVAIPSGTTRTVQVQSRYATANGSNLFAYIRHTRLSATLIKNTGQ